MSMIRCMSRFPFVLSVCGGLIACDGGGGDGTSSFPPPVPIAPLGTEAGETTDEVSPSRSSLNVASGARCQATDETFELPVILNTRGSDGEDVTMTNVSGRVTTRFMREEDSLEIVSQGDGVLAMRFDRADIVQLRLELPGSERTDGQTAYLAAFTPDMPDSVLLRKRLVGGCAYALRLSEVNFCSATMVRSGEGEPSSPREIGSGGISATIDGCEYTEPDGVAVRELPAEPGAEVDAP